MHCNSYIPGYYTMRDLSDETRNSWPLHHENKILNTHIYNGCMVSSTPGYSECDKQMLKRTMLEHEAIFRKQVFELHRLYRIQKDLMEVFQKNGLNRSVTCAIKANNSSSSFAPQSEITRNIWQICHQPAMSNTQSRGTIIVSNPNISPISFCEGNLQSCFGPRTLEDPERDVQSNADFRTPAMSMFDLRLPADVYIDNKITEGSQKEQCSSSLTTVPYSRKYIGEIETEVKLTLSNVNGQNARISDHKYDSDSKSSHFHFLADLNETVNTSLEETEYSTFPSQSFDPGRKLDENHRPDDGSLRSESFLLRSSFSKKRDCVELDSSNILSTLKNELIQASSSSHRQSDQFKGNISTHSGIEKRLISFEPKQQSLMREHETLLMDHNKAEMDSMEISKKCSRRNGFNHGFDRDSRSVTQLGLSYSNMDLNSVESSYFDVRIRETSSKNMAAIEVVEDLEESSPGISWLKTKPSPNESLNLNLGNEKGEIGTNNVFSEEKTQINDDISVLGKIHSNQIDEFGRDSLLIDINTSVLNNNFRKHIDLNCEAPFLDEPCFSKLPETSDSLPASEAFTLIHTEPSVMALEEYNTPQIHDVVINEAAENMIKLSLDKFRHSDDDQSLHWLVDLALLNTEWINSEIDLFELKTLQLEEMKPDETSCSCPREAEKVKAGEKSMAVLLLKKTRRGHTKKRRQRRDFQKDTLPGLATLSRQEMVEDLQLICGLMKASGFHWEMGARPQNGGRNRTQTPVRRRCQPRKTTLKKELNSNSKTMFVFEGPGMIGWGNTRRCRRPRCPPQSVTTVLT